MQMDARSGLSHPFRKQLGDGLVLRWSTPEDTEGLAHLVGMAFRHKADQPLNKSLAEFVRSLMTGRCPFTTPYDYGLVEDTSRKGHPIVACASLWRHDWEYEGIRFPIGRPEMVASDPQYRHQGLIRELFAMLHAQSESEGRIVQGVTGIPYFYRQFGYEYALDLGGSQTVKLAHIPPLKAGEQERCTLRRATVEDIPFIQKCYTQRQGESIVWNALPDAFWRFNIEEWEIEPAPGRPRNVHNDVQIIVDPQGCSLGYVFTAARRWEELFRVWAMDLVAGVNARELMPSLLRALKTLGEQAIVEDSENEPMQSIKLYLGGTHPLYDAFSKQLAPVSEKPYAWYVRVSDLPAFMRLIAPALERRLADSILAGYRGEVKLNFFRDGLRLVFQDGKLTQAEPWRAPIYEPNESASFAPLVFLQLLFGRRSLEELEHVFPETRVSPDTEIVLHTLFPTRPSFVYG
ncbi:GNAT family N-acetyltransferase [Ktedonospora formicarum]|uniref:Uncharacterized protein n=1 Tax=Ktedonospora formicarum TaxID=2778364 RepID=A0A8J3I242_9CHLR|nr:GNAT family N-acetyltransferase [Ktedonospora formicarum]GHO45323.1 hypothetical protein KSX_34860 [Ktedonospora formicarum]